MKTDQTELVDDMELLYPDSIPPEVISGLSEESLDRVEDIGTASTSYLLLGSYDSPQKQRLQCVGQILSAPAGDEAFTLEEIDPEVNVWENFYVKFRLFLLRCDYVVAVFESNDGGHELEIGEASIGDTYVLKRDYESISVDHDVEYAKYDAMLGTLFDLLDRRDRLLEWETKRELYAGAAELSARLGHGEPP